MRGAWVLGVLAVVAGPASAGPALEQLKAAAAADGALGGVVDGTPVRAELEGAPQLPLAVRPSRTLVAQMWPSDPWACSHLESGSPEWWYCRDRETERERDRERDRREREEEREYCRENPAAERCKPVPLSPHWPYQAAGVAGLTSVILLATGASPVGAVVLGALALGALAYGLLRKKQPAQGSGPAVLS